MKLRFDERVVVVTGAGLGLGRSYALEFARRGAHVVVNDVGRSQASQQSDLAQNVVDEIITLGGSAAASTHSVEDGQLIIEQTLDHYGRIDALINNAGLLRNNSFLKMTEEEWDLVYRVHVLGTMRVTKAAWPHMRDARYGRVVMTTSNAGFFGSLGAANYAAAKAATIAFAQTLALEGATRNIKVNAIAPMAGSRLTQQIWPPKVMDAFPPERVTPGVVFLAHETSPVTGRVFEIGGGWISELRWEQSEGVLFEREFTAEDVAARWLEVERFQAESGGGRAKDYIARIEQVTGERVTL